MYILATASRSHGAPGDSVYPHQCAKKRSGAPGSNASTSAMVRDSASELDSKYFAVNSYFPKYCSIRKGLICMANECARREAPQSSAKLSRHAQLAAKKNGWVSPGRADRIAS